MSVAAARGPLSSVLAQWGVIGLGGLGFLGNEDFSASIWRGVQFAFNLSSKSLVAPANGGHQPIVIHTGGANTSSNAKLMSSLIQLAVGAAVCWGSYLIFSTCLPDYIKEMLPVTRKFFDVAITTLGKSVINVREMLSEQIMGVSEKQDELSEKQDATHDEVLGVKTDLGDMRLDLGDIHQTLDRCESSLTEAELRQSYTNRGVSLLLRCVGVIMPRNTDLTNELENFSKLGDELNQDQEQPQSSQSVRALHQSSQSNKSQKFQSPHRTRQMQSPIPEQRQYENLQQYTPIVTAMATPHMNSAGGKQHFISPMPGKQTPRESGLDDVRALLEVVRGGMVPIGSS